MRGRHLDSIYIEISYMARERENILDNLINASIYKSQVGMFILLFSFIFHIIMYESNLYLYNFVY
jgi:hypothetical protein